MMQLTTAMASTGRTSFCSAGISGLPRPIPQAPEHLGETKTAAAASSSDLRLDAICSWHTIGRVGADGPTILSGRQPQAMPRSHRPRHPALHMQECHSTRNTCNHFSREKQTAFLRAVMARGVPHGVAASSCHLHGGGVFATGPSVWEFMPHLQSQPGPRR